MIGYQKKILGKSSVIPFTLWKSQKEKTERDILIIWKKKKKKSWKFPKLEKQAHSGPGNKESHKQDQPKKVHTKT